MENMIDLVIKNEWTKEKCIMAVYFINEMSAEIDHHREDDYKYLESWYYRKSSYKSEEYEIYDEIIRINNIYKQKNNLNSKKLNCQKEDFNIFSII